jgi:2-oxoglutarate ferredoxin oxidoreductase subunit delta
LAELLNVSKSTGANKPRHAPKNICERVRREEGNYCLERRLGHGIYCRRGIIMARIPTKYSRRKGSVEGTMEPIDIAEKKPRLAHQSPKRLLVYRSWCKRCGICVAFCPKIALERDGQGYPRWSDPGRCVGCRMCELRCPDFAIEVVEEGKGDAPGK